MIWAIMLLSKLDRSDGGGGGGCVILQEGVTLQRMLLKEM